MATRKIEREKWVAFFPEFTRHHAGKTVTLSFFGPGSGSHDDTHTHHLIDIILEHPGGDNEQVTIRLGAEAKAIVTRTVNLPVQVWLKAGEDDVDETLEVRSEHGQVILLHFRVRED